MLRTSQTWAPCRTVAEDDDDDASDAISGEAPCASGTVSSQAILRRNLLPLEFPRAGRLVLERVDADPRSRMGSRKTLDKLVHLRYTAFECNAVDII